MRGYLASLFLVFLAACTPAAQLGEAPPSASNIDPACRSGDPLANVYHMYRLQVLQACAQASGIVRAVSKMGDGDYHVNLELDPGQEGMLNDANRKEQHGYLVTEIVPADLPGCTPGKPPKPKSGTYDYGICTGANLTVPAVGQHVRVTGPYVLDKGHGWMEIHPVWAVKVGAR